jgi:hypothetical protein
LSIGVAGPAGAHAVTSHAGVHATHAVLAVLLTAFAALAPLLAVGIAWRRTRIICCRLRQLRTGKTIIARIAGSGRKAQCRSRRHQGAEQDLRAAQRCHGYPRVSAHA